MEYCAPLGLPHSKFLGWDPSDQDKAIAWVIHNMSKCPQCGTFPEDYMGDNGRPLEPPPMVVKTKRCYGCVLLDDNQKEATGDGKHPPPPGLLAFLEHNPDFHR